MGMWSGLRALFGRKDEEERYGMDQFAAQKSFTYGGLNYPLFGGGSYGTKEVVENDFCGYVQSAFKSDGVVYACMAARAMIFSEARFQYQRFEKGRPQDLFGDSSLKLLEHPWPGGTTGELLNRAIQDADLSGNHYAVVENGYVRRLRPDWVEIILSADPAKAVEYDIKGYMYQAGGIGSGGEVRFYLPDQMVHWIPPGQTDPERQYMGMSWLTPVIREIQADKAATIHKAKFFENAATPNLAVSLKDTVTKEQFKEFMELMNNSHRGVWNAYETLYLGGGADVTVIGADFKQLDFKNTQGAGETRIAAAARVHPVIVGLSEGMQGSSLNAGNFKSAKDAFGDGTMRPLWRSICAAYEVLVKPPPSTRLWYDDRDIAFLRTDRQELAEIQATEGRTIAGLVMQGYTHDSVIAAILAEDWRLLKHSGLFSVQLQPPNSAFGNDQPDPKYRVPKKQGQGPGGGGGGAQAPAKPPAAAPPKPKGQQ